MLHFLVLLHRQFISSLIYRGPSHANMRSSVSSRVAPFDYKTSCVFLIKALALLYSSLYILFYIQSTFTKVSLLSGSHISKLTGGYVLR